MFAVENLPLFHIRFHWNERFALLCRFYMRCKLYFQYHIRLMFTLDMILCIAVIRPASLYSLTPLESNTPQSPTLPLVAPCFLSQLVTLIRQRNVAPIGLLKAPGVLKYCHDKLTLLHCHMFHLRLSHVSCYSE